MPWESIQIFQTMFVGKNNLEKKTWEVYVEDRLAQNYFKDLH
jgi:hypothetical protein